MAERKRPQQNQKFNLTGRVWSTKNSGAFIGTPLWNVRAGEVIRIADLVPYSVSTPEFDRLRTFFINETEYDAIANTLRIVPDRPSTDLIKILIRSIQMEQQR